METLTAFEYFVKTFGEKVKENIPENMPQIFTPKNIGSNIKYVWHTDSQIDSIL